MSGQKGLSTKDGTLSTLRKSHLFHDVSDVLLADLTAQMTPYHCAQGETLFRSGDHADAMYLLVSGKLAVVSQTKSDKAHLISLIEPGECVGELALLLAGNRTATIEAESPCELLRFSKEAFTSCMNQHLELRRLFSQLMENRLPLLRSSTQELFGELDDATLQELESCFSLTRYIRGDILFEQGDVGDSLYLVMHGRLQVLIPGDSEKPEVVAELGRGEWVGEMALMLDEPRTTTVRIARDSELLCLSKEGFETVMAKHPQVLLPLMKKLAKRLKETTVGRFQQKEALSTNIALIPLEAGLFPFPDAFINELEKSGKTLYLNAEKFVSLHGMNADKLEGHDPRSGHLTEWLSIQEEHHQHLMYQANPGIDPWTDRCIRQADRILFISRFDSSPELSAIEQHAHRLVPNTPCELVLVHPKKTSLPENTAAWLKNRKLTHHHHVHENTDTDFRRVARLITKQAIGLVLSGGGARGFAHIGIIKALQENQIPIDLVGGTSMGAYIGSLFACGYDLDTLIKIVREILVNRPRGIHYTLPYTSLMTIDKSEQRLKHRLAGINLEDLWLNFYCISANITQSDMQIHRDGPLWQALRATTALPGIFPPVFHNDQLLVDGGVINVLPIDIMNAENIGHIIASDVTRPTAQKETEYHSESATFVKMMMNRLNPFANPILAPKASHIMTRSMHLTSVMRKRKNMRTADLYLTPPVGQYSLLEMDQIDDLIKVGYDYGKTAIQENEIIQTIS